MLSYSGVTLLSFANTVVKGQPQKFVRSLYRVPRMLQYISIVFEFRKRTINGVAIIYRLLGTIIIIFRIILLATIVPVIMSRL